MGNRFQESHYKLAYSFIAERDGDYCLICGPKKDGFRYRLQIDHADNNQDNGSPENLHLLCPRCNCQKRQLPVAEQKKLIKVYSDKNVREREREHGTGATKQIKALVDYSSGSIEMQANSHYENNYREWLLANIKQIGFITKYESIHSGAEFVGCSSVTSDRYLKKMISATGVLKLARDPIGNTIVIFKDKPKPEPKNKRDPFKKRLQKKIDKAD